MYIEKSFKKSVSQKKEFFIFRDILVLLQQKLPDININSICRKIEKTIPKKFFKDLDYIYIGEFDELKIRNVQSAYLRGAIYISSEDASEESIYASIIHELAHSVESVFFEYIYGDQDVAAEFTAKRKKLRAVLKTQGLEYEEPTAFIRQEYNPKFDEFLYVTVGYDRLHQLIVGLYASPYAATSLREYFANGFEHYFMHDREYLKKICPRLYSKIYLLTKLGV